MWRIDVVGAGRGLEWGGVMVTNDDGDTWAMLEGFPPNYYVTDILSLSTNTTSSKVLLVSAQSHLFDRDDGGIWKSVDDGKTFARVDRTPTFNLYELTMDDIDTEWDNNNVILATRARNRTHSISLSTDSGDSFHYSRHWDSPPWNPRSVPFYTCATALGDGRVVLAGLTRLPGLPNHTDSQFFVTEHRSAVGDGPPDSGGVGLRWAPLEQSMSMDQDGMPKDRMALLADPELPDLFYVAGNAEALAWRVNATSRVWTKLWDEDVIDGSVPHGDCRNFAWDPDRDRLLLTTDGGVFAREMPRRPGGRWTSLNGDYASLELLSARYDPRDRRFVMGAQDNCAIITKPHATPSDPGYGFVFGDGAVTLVDSQATPSRLFGTTQFLGVGTVDVDPQTRKRLKDEDEDEEGCGGLCFTQGEPLDIFVEVPVAEYFPEPSSFPFFVHPYTLNVQDPTRLHFWTNGTSDRPSAIYEFHIPYSVRDKDDIPPPTKLIDTPKGEYFLDFVSGGYTARAAQTEGEPDPELLVAVSNKHIYVRSKSNRSPTGGFVSRPLPVEFALPLGLEYDADGQRILGPLTHARTVSMAVSRNDSSVVAVTGWRSIDDNREDESVFVTLDAGKHWRNVTGNLRRAAGVTGILRPGGLCWIDVALEGTYSNRVLLVGTSNGIMATVVEGLPKDDGQITSSSTTRNVPAIHQRWMRLGTREEFPLVLVADVDYEPVSDALVAATFGRGIYVLENATRLLPDLQLCLTMSPERAYCGECAADASIRDGRRHNEELGRAGECCNVDDARTPQLHREAVDRE